MKTPASTSPPTEELQFTLSLSKLREIAQACRKIIEPIVILKGSLVEMQGRGLQQNSSMAHDILALLPDAAKRLD